jgi:hypothetical protein
MKDETGIDGVYILAPRVFGDHRRGAGSWRPIPKNAADGHPCAREDNILHARRARSGALSKKNPVAGKVVRVTRAR